MAASNGWGLGVDIVTNSREGLRMSRFAQVGRLAKLGAKVVTMQVKNCCVVREELTEAEVAAEAAAASSGAGAEPAAPKPAGKGKRRGGRRHKAAAAKAAKAKAVDVAVAAEKTTSSERAPDAAEPAAKAADEEADAGEARGETTDAQTDAAEEAAGEEGEEEEAAAPSGPTRLVNRLEVDTTYDFDLVRLGARVYHLPLSPPPLSPPPLNPRPAVRFVRDSSLLQLASSNSYCRSLDPPPAPPCSPPARRLTNCLSARPLIAPSRRATNL